MNALRLFSGLYLIGAVLAFGLCWWALVRTGKDDDRDPGEVFGPALFWPLLAVVAWRRWRQDQENR